MKKLAAIVFGCLIQTTHACEIDVSSISWLLFKSNNFSTTLKQQIYNTRANQLYHNHGTKIGHITSGNVYDCDGRLSVRKQGNMIYDHQGLLMYRFFNNSVYNSIGAVEYTFRGNNIYDGVGRQVGTFK